MTIPPRDTGNITLSPPRLTGNPNDDVIALRRFLADFYDQYSKVLNVAGTLANHEARINALEHP